MSKEFKLGNQILIIEGDVEEYNFLYKRYKNEEKELIKNFKKAISKDGPLSDLYELNEYALLLGVERIKSFYLSFSDIFIKCGYHDFSFDYLEKQQEEVYVSIFKKYYEPVRKLEESLKLIDQYAESADRQRKLRKDSRTRLVGGGFGLTGALSGMLKAGAVNTVTGLAYDGVNAISKASTDSEISKYKNRLNDIIRTELVDGLRLSFWGTFLTVTHQLQVNVIYNENKAINILNNVNQGFFNNVDDVKNVLFEAFKYNPYSIEVYETYIKRCVRHDASNEEGLVEMANYFTVDLDQYYSYERVRYTRLDLVDKAKEIPEKLFALIDRKLQLGFIDELNGRRGLDHLLTTLWFEHLYKLSHINACIQCCNEMIDDLGAKDIELKAYIERFKSKFTDKKSVVLEMLKKKPLICRESSKHKATPEGVLLCQYAMVYDNYGFFDFKPSYEFYVGDVFPKKIYDEFSNIGDSEPYIYIGNHLLYTSKGIHIKEKDIEIFIPNERIRDIKLKDNSKNGNAIAINEVCVKTFSEEKDVIAQIVKVMGEVYTCVTGRNLENCSAEEVEQFREYYNQLSETEKANKITEQNRKAEEMRQKKEAERIAKEEEATRKKAEKTQMFLEKAHISDSNTEKEAFKDYDEWSKKFDENKGIGIMGVIFRLFVVFNIGLCLMPALGLGLVYWGWYLYRVNNKRKKFIKVRDIKLLEGEDVVDANITCMSFSWA